MSSMLMSLIDGRNNKHCDHDTQTCAFCVGSQAIWDRDMMRTPRCQDPQDQRIKQFQECSAE